MLFRKIVTLRSLWMRSSRRANATFGGNQHPRSHSRNLVQNLAKNPFRFTATINIGVVEKCVACFIRGNDGSVTCSAGFSRHLGRVPGTRDAPATVSQTAAPQRTDTQQ